MRTAPLYGVLVSVALLPLLAGCPCFPPPDQPQSGAKAMSPAKVGPKPCGAAGTSNVVQYLPGPTKDCAAVKVEKTAPETVYVGREFEYHIKVTNLAEAELVDVKVWDTQLPSFKIRKTAPAASKTEKGWLVWELGRLKPHEAKLIRVHGMATEPATLAPCAEVTYRMPRICLKIRAVEPALVLTKTAPAERLQCETIPVMLTIKNTGSGEACDVEIRDPLPNGLKTTDGKKELRFVVGRLAPGQSRQFEAQLNAEKVGRYENKAFATAAGGLRTDAKPTVTTVMKPDLSVTKTGPEMRYAGRPVAYDITVTNGAGAEKPTTADAMNTVLTDTVPAGARFVSATHGGELQRGKVVWRLGTIKPGGSKTVQVTFVAEEPCVLRNTASVTASCGKASGSARTTIEGRAAIRLEVFDLEDAIEVGSNVTYRIAVKNQGTAVGTNIRIGCVIPAEQAHVSSTSPKGVGKAKVDGQKVTFPPLAELQPGATVEYFVTVKARRAGDVRFAVTLNSDQMTTPAEETEPTRLYE
jgi:uncharacterized repeat protein (TIGR01451 family)